MKVMKHMKDEKHGDPTTEDTKANRAERDTKRKEDNSEQEAF